MSSSPSNGASSAVGFLADSLSVIYRGHEFEPHSGHKVSWNVIMK